MAKTQRVGHDGSVGRFIMTYHKGFGFWFLLFIFWRTTATVVKKFPMNRTKKQRPHIKT